jgi:hypothetical protein
MQEKKFNELLKKFIDHSAEVGDLNGISKMLTVGFVVDTDDPLQQGRLRVFCPAYNDDPKKLLHLPWCAYVMPFGGSINQDSYTRGSKEGNELSQGPIHYGFWGIPDIGAHVLVGCVNGDVRRRFWLGCFPQHQETHTIGNGRFKHRNGNVDGPLTSTQNPIEPLSSNLREAFEGQTNSPEWKTRAADYQITALFDRPSPDKALYVDDNLETIQQNEIDSWVRDILGEPGYDWTSYKNLASFLASKVYSWTTPGFHSITADDRPFNCRIRIRTTGGNQIILDDTNERIYFSTAGGKSWIEMDAAGNIDLFAERRLSIHAEKDLNLSAGESIRMKANNFISMYAGDTRGQSPLSEEIARGEIRMHSSNDFHLKSEGNFRMNVEGDYFLGVDGEGNLNLSGDLNIGAGDVGFAVSGANTTISDMFSTYNSHMHGANGMAPPTRPFSPQGVSAEDDETEIAAWTNRVPQHEPWPRVLMQDSDDPVNAENDGYKNNVDWIEQYDNEGQAGREPVGRVEGDETIDRGRFWRR